MISQVRLLILGMLLATTGQLYPASAFAQSLQFVGCDNAEQSRVKERFRWLRTQSSAIVDGVSARKPDGWKGNAKKRFQSLFRSGALRVECTRSAELCETPHHNVMWWETEYPAPHRYPITLCMDLLQEPEALTSVLVHLLAHHILLAQDQTDCVKRCEQPRLANLVTQSTQSLMSGEVFSLEWCLTACAPQRDTDVGITGNLGDAGMSPTDTTAEPASMDTMPKSPTKTPTPKPAETSPTMP